MYGKEIRELLDSVSYDIQEKIGFSLMNYIVAYSDESEGDNISFENIFEFVKEKIDYYQKKNL